MNPLLIKNLTAGGPIGARRLVKFGATEGQVVQAAGPSDLIIGVCIQPGGVAAAGDRVDVVLTGIADVEAGAAFAQGLPITSDAQGRAVAAAPATGANANLLGRAYAPATAVGDIAPVLLALSTIQGA